MKKLLITFLILLLVIAPVVPASNHCADMGNAVAGSISNISSSANESSVHEHHMPTRVVNDTKPGCDCTNNMDCVAHLSVYVAMSDLSVKTQSFPSNFLIYNVSLSPSETISPEIKPPSPFV